MSEVEVDERAGDPVLAETDGPVRTLTFNRPARLNAFTADSYRALATFLREADREPGVRVVVLRGAGRGFSSGVDLDALAGRPEAPVELGRAFDDVVEAVSAFSKPLVAAVHGPAVGFGATVLLHCDLVVVADDARLRFPFTLLGTAPEAASSVLLPALVGPQRAAELLYTSRWIDAAEAVALGIALRSCRREELDGEVGELARAVAEREPTAVASAKRLLRAGRPTEVRVAMARERREAGLLTAALGPLRRRDR